MKNILRSSRGQALIELIVFLPMMFMIYSLISGFASAINGSINQQKITRAYFYFRTQNNSTAPTPDYPDQGYKTWQRFGMTFIGWRAKFLPGDNPSMACYRVSLLTASGKDKECDQAYNEPVAQFIRVGTIYGICGASYQVDNGEVSLLPHRLGSNVSSVVDPSGCLIY